MKYIKDFTHLGNIQRTMIKPISRQIRKIEVTIQPIEQAQVSFSSKFWTFLSALRGTTRSISTEELLAPKDPGLSSRLPLNSGLPYSRK